MMDHVYLLSFSLFLSLSHSKNSILLVYLAISFFLFWRDLAKIYSVILPSLSDELLLLFQLDCSSLTYIGSSSLLHLAQNYLVIYSRDYVRYLCKKTKTIKLMHAIEWGLVSQQVHMIYAIESIKVPMWKW